MNQNSIETIEKQRNKIIVFIRLNSCSLINKFGLPNFPIAIITLCIAMLFDATKVVTFMMYLAIFWIAIHVLALLVTEFIVSKVKNYTSEQVISTFKSLVEYELTLKNK